VQIVFARLVSVTAVQVEPGISAGAWKGGGYPEGEVSVELVREALPVGEHDPLCDLPRQHPLERHQPPEPREHHPDRPGVHLGFTGG